MSLERKLDELNDLMTKSIQIQTRIMLLNEKTFLAVNALLPKDAKVLSFTDREMNARRLLGLTLFGTITPREVKTNFRLAAKKVHPDVNGGETTDQYLALQEAQAYLLEILG